MTVQECYEAMGADYKEVLRRLGNAERVERFLLKFPEDRSYEELIRAMESGDCESAFRAAHTLKGICLNLSLTPLAESSIALTESLRGGERSEETGSLFEAVIRDYDRTIQAIRILKHE